MRVRRPRCTHSYAQVRAHACSSSKRAAPIPTHKWELMHVRRPRCTHSYAQVRAHACSSSALHPFLRTSESSCVFVVRAAPFLDASVNTVHVHDMSYQAFRAYASTGQLARPCDLLHI